MKAMRLKQFFASAVFLLAGIPAFCCGPYWYMPEEYYMYRVYDKSSFENQLSEIERNCAEWKRLTSSSINEDDIREVVYKYSKKKTAAILSSRSTGNSFADWLKKKNDTEIVDFLVLAKTCEEARAEMNDPWYYPSKNDPVMATLDELAAKADSYSGTRLKDRYMLQAVRALFSLQKFSQIDSLWQCENAGLKDGIIKEMIYGYVAGAAFNNGDIQKAVDYYTAKNDLHSLSMCLRRQGKDGSPKGILNYAAEHCPDSPQIPEILQRLFYGMEPDGIFYYQNTEDHNYPDYKKRARMCLVYDKHKTEDYISICLKAAAKAKEPGIWYYTAAYLTDLLGRPEQASSLANKAADARKSVFLAESVRVLQIYLDAKTAKYDSNYDTRLLSQLKWLDEKVKNSITDDVRKTTEAGYYLHIGISYHYWNDMMRRILISEVCPRMEDAGKPVTALTLLNMADNRLLSLVNTQQVSYYDMKADEYKDIHMSLDEYRHSKYFNMYDFSNYYFLALDKIGLKHVEQYAVVLRDGGRNPLEQFAIARGFKDIEYIYDLIGTRYLRERKYAKAAAAFAKVSSGYQKRLNVNPYFDRDPFQYGFTETGKPFENYKLNFAEEMRALEKKMTSQDPDIRGTAMVKYGIGLRSSFDYCWALTQYHLNYEDPWLKEDYRTTALKDSDEYIRKGLTTIVDKEKAAEANLSVGRWLTIAEKYADTEVGKRVLAQCDKLYDHKGNKLWKNN